MEIITKIQAEDDIKLAYPTQHLLMERDSQKVPSNNLNTLNEDSNITQERV